MTAQYNFTGSWIRKKTTASTYKETLYQITFSRKELLFGLKRHAVYLGFLKNEDAYIGQINDIKEKKNALAARW